VPTCPILATGKTSVKKKFRGGDGTESSGESGRRHAEESDGAGVGIHFRDDPAEVFFDGIFRRDEENLLRDDGIFRRVVPARCFFDGIFGRDEENFRDYEENLRRDEENFRHDDFYLRFFEENSLHYVVDLRHDDFFCIFCKNPRVLTPLRAAPKRSAAAESPPPFPAPRPRFPGQQKRNAAAI
jgi:hypothetical protein